MISADNLPYYPEGLEYSHSYPLYVATHSSWNNKINAIKSNVKQYCGASSTFDVYDKIRKFADPTNTENVSLASDITNYYDAKVDKNGYVDQLETNGDYECVHYLYDAVNTYKVFQKWFDIIYVWSYTNYVDDDVIKTIDVTKDSTNEFFDFYQFYHLSSSNDAKIEQQTIETIKKSIDKDNDADWTKVLVNTTCKDYLEINDPCESVDAQGQSACYSSESYKDYTARLNECSSVIEDFVAPVIEAHDSECKSRQSPTLPYEECLRQYLDQALENEVKYLNPDIEEEDDGTGANTNTNKSILNSLYLNFENATNSMTEAMKERNEAYQEAIALAKSINYKNLSVNLDYGDVVINCEDFALFHFIWRFIIIAAPFLLIIFGIIDFFKVTVAADEKGMHEAKKKFPKRVIAFLLLLIVPTIIYVLFSFFDFDSNMLETMRCVIKGS